VSSHNDTRRRAPLGQCALLPGFEADVVRVDAKYIGEGRILDMPLTVGPRKVVVDLAVVEQLAVPSGVAVLLDGALFLNVGAFSGGVRQ
jgi:hypothetical protein